MTKDEMKASRRLVRVPVSLPFLHSMCIEGREIHGVCTKGLPEDAEFVGDAFDYNRMAGHLFFYHQSFEQVKDGGTVPEMVIEWTLK